MRNRREFLACLAAAPAAVATPRLPARERLAELLASHGAAADPRPASQVATDEAYWADIGRAFTVDRSLLNLNNGGVSPAPAFVQEAQVRHLAFSNQAPVYTMWRILRPQREAVRQQLARQLRCDPDELALTRNASESLQICQFGFDLQRGDVVLTSDQDYPRMIATFQQRERREGIKLEQLHLPQPCDDPAEITAAFAAAMDEHRPKLVLCSHVLFTTGQALPVRDICAAARERGIPCVVDGAHAFAHLDVDLEEIGCDYYAASLHKWLFAPHGTGFLFVKKDKIKGLWPLMAAGETLDEDIRKFEEVGTQPMAQMLAIAEALQFYQGIGPARKYARMVYLREYWLTRVADRFPEQCTVHTSRAPGQAGVIANITLRGIDPRKLNGHLFRRHRIIATAIGGPGFDGTRVSPSIYTTPAELDRFVDAMVDVLENGLPG